MDRATPKIAYGFWLILIWLIGLAPLIGAISYSRPYNDSTLIGSYAGGILSALDLYMIVGVAAMGIMLTLASGIMPEKGGLIWLGAMALCIGPMLATKLAYDPHFQPVAFVVPLIFTAMYVLPTINYEWFVKRVKQLILFYVYLGLLLAVLKPAWSMDLSYDQGILPGLNIRYFGLFTHANNFAAVLCVYAILNIFLPSRTLLGKISYLLVLGSLLLTQSKTVWGILIIAYAVTLWYKSKSMNGLLRAAAVFFLLAVLLAGALLSSNTILSHLGSDESLMQLTGRTVIWDYTTQMWEMNKLFGYGHELWSRDMVLNHTSLRWFPAHAHNQFYQTLGESGIIGVIGLFVYLLFLLPNLLRYRVVTNGASIGILLYLLIRGFTEPVFRTVLGDGNFLVHFIVLTTVTLIVKNAVPTLSRKRVLS